MNDLPSAVAERVHYLCIERRAVSYLRVGADGTVLETGGTWTHYGLRPRRGDVAADGLPLLAGLLPLAGETVDLPLLQLPESEDRYVHLHAFPGAGGDWVLLLDATREGRNQAALQQHAHELALARRGEARAAARVQRSRRDLLTVLDQLRILTLVIDAEGRTEFLSRSGKAFLGLGAADVAGMPWEDVLAFPLHDRTQIAALMATAAPQRERLRLQTRLPSGRPVMFDIQVEDAPDEPGKRLLYLYDQSEAYDLRRMLKGDARFADMVGRSAAMARVFQLIRDLARVDSTVLIQGETGTGKELVARAVHDLSARRDGPLVVVNCAGLSDSLINSQLFGHRRGAFTDAVRDQEGVFEAAHGGTIVLDEIGDVPMNTQTRLLRVLEQREIVRIGETQPRQIDIRVLTATNRDLDEAVRRGQFRADLLYRIRVARIVIPPLRERREDIPLLIEAFLQQAAAASGKSVTGLSGDAMRLLLDHTWPGNVRELRNAIEFAVIHVTGETIGAGDLPPEVSGPEARVQTRRPYRVAEEKERILGALEQVEGRRGEAARLLGISRATLYRRMKACFITPADLPKHAAWR